MGVGVDMTTGIVEETVEVYNEEMVQRMIDNEEKIANQEVTLKEHDKLLALHSEKINAIETSTIKLENLVMTENRETRAVIMSSNKDLHTLINNVLGFKSGENQLKHSMTMARAESIVKIVSLLAGSGGILYWIFGQ